MREYRKLFLWRKAGGTLSNEREFKEQKLFLWRNARGTLSNEREFKEKETLPPAQC